MCFSVGLLCHGAEDNYGDIRATTACASDGGKYMYSNGFVL